MVEGLRDDCLNLTYLRPEGGNRMRTTGIKSPANLAEAIWAHIARGNPSSIAVPLTNGAAREAFLNAFPDLAIDDEPVSRCRALKREEIIAAGLLPVDDLSFVGRIKALVDSHREIYQALKKNWKEK